MSRFFAVVVLLVACGGQESNLPEGWEEASLIVDFAQTVCLDEVDSDEEIVEEIRVNAQSGAAVISWKNVVFRCEQPLEAYLRRGNQLDVLVQPVDLFPEDIVRCDCRYDLDFAFNIGEGERRFGFFVRRDQVGGSSSPSLVGTVVIP